MARNSSTSTSTSTSTSISNAVAAALLGLLLGACRPALSRLPSELKLIAVLPIDAPEHFQPSGLALEGGRLLTVADHDDTAIYELELGADVARAKPYITFASPVDAASDGGAASATPGTPLDFEGISRVAEGRFWLLSEGRYRVLEVTRATATGAAGRARWLTRSVEAIGRAAGLFQVPGGDVEGLTPLPTGGLLIAAERQPRGLIELKPGFELGTAQVWALPESVYFVPPSRAPDFADLTLVDGEVYALLRNGHLVERLEQTATGWREGRAWSYGAVENDPRFVYVDPKYGVAEGLVVSDREVLIVIDNNEQPRAAAPGDRRALLMRFERPRELGSEVAAGERR